MAEIKEGMQIRVEVPDGGRPGIPVKTVSWGPLTGDVREYHRQQTSGQPGRFMFGTVLSIYQGEPAKVTPVLGKDGKPIIADDGEPLMRVIRPAKLIALVRWDGRRYRTSVLPTEILVDSSVRPVRPA